MAKLKRLSDTPLPVALLLAGAIVASISIVRIAGFLELPELVSHDILLALTSTASDEAPPVVLVGVTEEEIQSLGHWPLTDQLLADTIKRIQTYHPRVIGIDIYRDQAVPPGGDVLHALMSESEDLVFIHRLGNNGMHRIQPPDPLQDTDRIGFSDMLIDAGGVVRRGLLYMDDGEQAYQSFALALALKYLQMDGIYPQPGEPDPTFLRLGDVTISPFEANDGPYTDADAGGYQFLLDYRGGWLPFRQLSLDDLATASVGEVIKDSVVILGVTAESVKDLFITPFSHASLGNHSMNGIVLHGYIVDQLIRMAKQSESPIRVMSDTREILLIALWGLLAAIVAVYIKALWKFLVVFLAGVAIIIYIPYTAHLAGWWVPLVPTAMAWILTAGTVLIFLRSRERAHRKQLMDLFSRNVSVKVAEDIWQQRDQFHKGGRLASREVIATVLFSDLENFTPLAEKLGPVRLMDWLNRYMEIMAGLVIEYGGIVDDYYGDAIMADFGVPLVRDTAEEITMDARNAVNCALAMRAALDDLNRECSEDGYPEVRMRIGICTGHMVAGFLGNKDRMKYTTIGDTVNTASRLESYGKELPPMDNRERSCRILIGEDTYQRLGDGYITEYVDDLELKGKNKRVPVFKVIALSG